MPYLPFPPDLPFQPSLLPFPPPRVYLLSARSKPHLPPLPRPPDQPRPGPLLLVNPDGRVSTLRRISGCWNRRTATNGSCPSRSWTT
jgi:hypothetical protein